MSLKQTVLVIDDDPVMIFIIQQQFAKQLPEDSLICFQEAENAIEYLKDYSRAMPDLILLDINMPGMNGWDFLDELKSGRISEDRIPAVTILSSSVDPHDHIKAKTYSNVISFLTKPLQLETVKILLNKKTPETENRDGR